MREKRKPGVMIYFDPMHKEALDLDDARAAWLFRAILDYADPETEKEPEFDGDEVKYHVWNFVRSAVNRDDTVYSRKIGNRYSLFCRYARAGGFGRFEGNKFIPPLSRAEWDEAGQPTFKQWEALQPTPQPMIDGFQEPEDDTNEYERIQTNPTNTDEYERSQTNTNEYGRIRSYTTKGNVEKRSSTTDSASMSATDSASFSMSETESYSDHTQSGAEAPPLSLPLSQSLREWKEYQKEIGRPVTGMAEKALAAQMGQYAEKYGADRVAALVRESMSAGWKTIPWDRLDRTSAPGAPGTEAERQAEHDAAIRKYVQELHKDREGKKSSRWRKGETEAEQQAERDAEIRKYVQALHEELHPGTA